MRRRRRDNSNLISGQVKIGLTLSLTMMSDTRSLGCVLNLCPKAAFSSRKVTLGTIDATARWEDQFSWTDGEMTDGHRGSQLTGRVAISGA